MIVLSPDELIKKGMIKPQNTDSTIDHVTPANTDTIVDHTKSTDVMIDKPPDATMEKSTDTIMDKFPGSTDIVTDHNSPKSTDTEKRSLEDQKAPPNKPVTQGLTVVEISAEKISSLLVSLRLSVRSQFLHISNWKYNSH